MITKTLKYFLMLLLITAVGMSCGEKKPETEGESESTEESSGDEPASTSIASPRQTASGEIGGAKITVDYGSPAVKGREIWGGLEAYGKVWRAGANETTSVEFSKGVQVGETEVPAGKYGFYLIPNEGKPWIAIFNTDWNRDEHGAWGAYNYNKDNDVARLEIEPDWLEEVTERLKYTVGSDRISLNWEKVQINIPVAGIAAE
ncbi:MAG: DUF2911 domain-containing protein [Bacteroidota bacterium]